MPPSPAVGATTARNLDEQFFDLICGDADLLAAEFDAIIAAEWSAPPDDGPGRGTSGRHPRRDAARRAADAVRAPIARPGHPGIGEGARQRSPPFRTPTQDMQEGR
jgi:hypothetical protein